MIGGLLRMKFLFILLSFTLLVVSGCNQGAEKNEEENGTEKQQNMEQSKIETKKENVPNDESDGEDINKPEEKKHNDVKVEDVSKEPQYRINSKTFSVEPIDDADEKVVLLTIDDAPDKYAVEMAKTLKDLGVKAIFFVNGHFIDSDEEKQVLKKIHEMGFPIGNHTWNHKKLPNLSKEEQRKEIVSLSDEIEKLTGERPNFFRAPHGLNTEYSKKVVAEEKMVLMNWSYGYDFMKDYMTKEAIADIMVNTNLLHNGSNLLLHDREWTNAALHDIVTGLQDKGYKIVDPALIEKP